jgi:hypothetical protein
MRYLLTILTVIGISACSRPVEPHITPVPTPIPIVLPPTQPAKPVDTPKQPIGKLLDKAKWHADYAAGLIKAHQAKLHQIKSTPPR